MSWFPLPGGKALLVAVAVGLFSWLAVSNWGYRKELQLTQQQLSAEQLENSKQARLIATLQTQDAQNRALMATQQQQEHQLRQRHDLAQRKLRDALKSDKCGNSPMPAAVIDLLQHNAAIGTATGGAFTP